MTPATSSAAASAAVPRAAPSPVPLEAVPACASGDGGQAPRRVPWPARRPTVRRDAGDVYRSLAPAVLGYLRAERAADAEDLLGEVFVHVVKDLARFRGDDAALRRWVFTLAHHRLVDERRRSRRRPVLSSAPVPELPVIDALPIPADPQLLGALTRLTPEQREVVALRFVADLPIEAVATLTRRSPGAVKALQHRALGALAALLEPAAPTV